MKSSVPGRKGTGWDDGLSEGGRGRRTSEGSDSSI